MEKFTHMAVLVIAGLTAWKFLVPLLSLLLDLERLAQFRQAIAKSIEFRPEITDFKD